MGLYEPNEFKSNPSQFASETKEANGTWPHLF